MSMLADISFYEVCMALLTVGLTERVLLRYAPIEMVGPNGWLITTNLAE